jgi:hypothetical protein
MIQATDMCAARERRIESLLALRAVPALMVVALLVVRLVLASPI